MIDASGLAGIDRRALVSRGGVAPVAVAAMVKRLAAKALWPPAIASC